MPPSSSRSDCEAVEADCAPRRGVKLNIIVGALIWLATGGHVGEDDSDTLCATVHFESMVLEVLRSSSR